MSLKAYPEEAEQFRILKKEDFDEIAKSGPSEELQKRIKESRVVFFEDEDTEEDQ